MRASSGSSEDEEDMVFKYNFGGKINKTGRFISPGCAGSSLLCEAFSSCNKPGCSSAVMHGLLTVASSSLVAKLRL